MRLTEMLAEAWRSAWAAKVPTVLVAIVVAAMCVTTGLTVGRAAAAQATVGARLEDAGSRHLTVTDDRGIGFLSRDLVAQVDGLSVVERAVGLTAAADTVNHAVGPGGRRVPAWQVVGDLEAVVVLTHGRLPGPGEALVSATAQAALGLDAPAGAVTGVGGSASTHAVVGAFAARPPFDHLDAGLVVRAPESTVARRIDVVATTPEAARAAQDATLAVLDRPDPRELTVTSPLSLAQIQADVLGDLARYNHTLVLMVLLAGAVLVAVVVMADVLVRSAELGRRRALGSPRWALVSILTVRSAVGAATGAVAGSAAATVVLLRSGTPADAGFTAATAVLALLAAVGATVPPAVLAAHQDPVRVLRTP